MSGWRWAGVTSVIACGLLLDGCAGIPSIPNDTQFPVGEILRFTACQLQDAYVELDKSRRFPNFKAREYAISVQLQPKADTEVTARAGLTGKNILSSPYFNSWALGASTGGGAPGAGYDTTGHQDGAVYFTVKSSDLITPDKRRPLVCKDWSNAQHALLVNLQVRGWLENSARSTNDAIGKFSVDKHTFQAEITIQWDAGGAFTYNFPLGTAYASASDRYKVDEILLVTITHEEPAKSIKNLVTLPSGGQVAESKTDVVRSTATISPETKTRLDLLQLQQSLQNLQINVPR